MSLTFLLLIALISSGCCCVPANDPEKLAERVEELDDWRRKIKKVRKATPKPSDALKRVKCPDEAIIGAASERSKSGKKPVFLKATTYTFLKKHASRSKGAYTKGKDPWAWTIWDGLEKLAAAGTPSSLREANNILFRLNHEESRYLAVLRGRMTLPEIKSDPAKLLRPKAEAVAGKHYRRGEVDAWAFVFDLDKGKIICQTPVWARSSKTVSFKTRGITQRDHDDVTEGDFKDRFEEGMNDAVGNISEVLSFTRH